MEDAFRVYICSQSVDVALPTTAFPLAFLSYGTYQQKIRILTLLSPYLWHRSCARGYYDS